MVVINLDDLSLEETYIVARFMYRVGKPIMSDAVYDDLHEMMVTDGLLTEYTSRTYDDDPTPSVHLLNKAGIVEIGTNNTSKRDASFLIEDKSKSIQSVGNMQAVYDFWYKHRTQQLIISIKMDGNNIKNEILDGELKLSLTRGRASNGIDVTDAMLRIIPDKVGIAGHRIVTGEVFLPPQHLERIRSKYGNEDSYKTSKSAAISFIRRPQDHAADDYSLLDFRAFFCDGIADTVFETYKMLEKSGFHVSPHEMLEDIPEDYDSFSSYMGDVMERLHGIQLEQGLPADGLVLEVNDLTTEAEIKDQYDLRQIALKFGPWQSLVYKGRITSIIVEQRRVMCCCKVMIEPIVTADGCEATTINIFNPSYLLNAGLKVGDEIEFERNSGAVNIYVGQKKIKFNTSEKEIDE